MEYLLDPRMVQLVKVEYEAYMEDEEREPELEVLGRVHVGQEEGEELFVIWDLTLDYHPMFFVRAIYISLVFVEEDVVLDRDQLIQDTDQPILAEFSQLVGTLSRSMLGTPLIVNPAEFHSEVWDLGGDWEDWYDEDESTDDLPF